MKRFLLMYISLISVGPVLYAQTTATNTGILYVTGSSDIFYAGSDFTNNSGSALTNNGQLYVKGNLSNGQSSMTVGTGTLYLNGSSAQSVNGAQVFKTYNLNTNNGAGVTLNNNLSVSGVHTFSAGLIITSATPNYLVYEAGSSYTGDNDSKHVNGWVKKYGNTAFAFPVGDATYERTAAITALAATSEFNVKYYTPTSNVFNLFSPLIQVHANEYWQINQISGGSTRVTLNWDNSKVAMDNVLVADIRVSYYSASYWRDGQGTASGNVTTTGTITSSPGTLFSLPFTFGYTATPLPLKIISFTGERKTGTSFLHWITENEQNLDRFDIQRSYNTTTYTTIGNVIGINNSGQQYYDFEDHSSFQGVAYYRLRSVDKNGQISYSKVITLSEQDMQASSFYVVNPVRSAITIFNKSGQEGNFDYRLFNAAGQQVLNGKVNMMANGGASLRLAEATAAGMYILELNNSKISFKQKLLVEK